jgi:hypothetical protein
VAVDVHLIGVDADAQLGRVVEEPRLDPDRQQRDRELAVQRRHELIRAERDSEVVRELVDPGDRLLHALRNLDVLRRQCRQLLLGRRDRALRRAAPEQRVTLGLGSGDGCGAGGQLRLRCGDVRAGGVDRGEL